MFKLACLCLPSLAWNNVSGTVHRTEHFRASQGKQWTALGRGCAVVRSPFFLRHPSRSVGEHHPPVPCPLAPPGHPSALYHRVDTLYWTAPQAGTRPSLEVGTLETSSTQIIEILNSMSQQTGSRSPVWGWCKGRSKDGARPDNKHVGTYVEICAHP